MHAFDYLLLVLLVVGCGLSLRIYWWLFVTPLVKISRRLRTRKATARKPR